MVLVGERTARLAGRFGATAWVRRYALNLALLTIIFVGGALRFTGLDWDDGQYLHPDERFLVMVALGINGPAGIGEYFDSESSPLNPYNRDYGTFVYGTFPLFLVKAVGDLFGYRVYGDLHIAGRAISGIFDLATVLLVFLIGRRLFGPFAGLVGSLLMSLTVLNIQASHFFTVDSFATALCLATFYFALRADDEGRWWEYALTGVAAGLAVASKLSALPILAVALLPLAEQIRRHGWPAWLSRPPATKPRLRPVLGVALALICALWVFRVAQPYAFAGPSPFSFKLDPRWTDDIRHWRDVQAGIADMPPSHQWADRTPVLFVLRHLVLWGMGPLLGIAALLGLAFAGFRIATVRRWPPAWQLVLIGWPVFHILYYGSAFLKTMRYLLPAYPFLVLLAAGLLVHLWPRGATNRLSLRLGHIPLIAVVVGTALYALAFTTIYTRPVTRIAASEWIYETIPPGTTVVTEHWDDGIPKPLPGYSISDYPGTQLELYHDDNQEKLDNLIRQLDNTDYIFITSNRLYESIPRIPERFPMTIVYYDLLFSGDLGFDLVKTFTSYPQLFGVELSDDGAEEAFTVYDHPKVLIFQKTDRYWANHDQTEQLLQTELDQDIVNLRPIQTGKNMLMLTDGELETQQAGGTWNQIFDRDGLTNRFPTVAWYLALQLMALAALPLCWRLLNRLPDRGYAVAKTIGLLFAGYVAWLLPSLHAMSFGRGAVAIGIGAAALLSLGAVWTTRRLFLRDLRDRWREILFAEALFLSAFLLFVWFRSINPDLWHRYRGGEKPMEFAYFNAILRSTHFPPYDPWFAGGYLNYYYFGYALLGSVTRLTAIVPAVAFNLAVPTIFALTVLNAWVFVTNLIRLLGNELRFRRWWIPLTLGLTGPIFVAVIGNLDMVLRIGSGEWGFPGATGDRSSLGWIVAVGRGIWNALFHYQPLPTDAFWGSSRIIDGTVNEFPYFSFLFADLHPHMMAIPFTIAALIIALAVVAGRRWPVATPDSSPDESNDSLFSLGSGWRVRLAAVPWQPAIERVGLIALTAFVTGSLVPLNTWDYPTYVAVTIGAFALLELLQWGRPGWTLSYSSLRRVALSSFATIVLGRLLFWPYLAHYELGDRGFIRWQEPSHPEQYLRIHGILLFFSVSFLLADLATVGTRRPGFRITMPTGITWTSRPREPDGRQVDASIVFAPVSRSLPLVVVVGGACAALALVGLWRDNIMLLLGSLLILTAIVAWRRRSDPLHLFIIGMIGLAIGLSIAVERYTLRGDVGRMNTVFKFYLQIWVLLALAAAVGLVILLMRHVHSVGRPGRYAWAAVAILLLLGGLTYPTLATPARLDDRFGDLPRTLDGAAYMDDAIYDDQPDDRPYVEFFLDADKAAIEWLQDNVEGSPVILEANTPLYRWGSRVSIYTGLPTVLGWDWHQTQQRPGYGPLVDERREDVQRILGDVTAFESIQPLLDKYHVRYIYVGDLERAYYDAAALAKFADAASRGLLDVVYDDIGVTIYRYDG